MNRCVRVLSVTHVQPEPPDQASTNPPPQHGVKLSLFDAMFIALAPIQRLFFYDGGSLPPYPSLVGSLRSSLAATLAFFTPLAGKLTVDASSSSSSSSCPGDAVVVIDCSSDAISPGVRFVEAEYSGDADDMRRLARDVEHDTEAFLQLVPELEVGTLPAPVLAVQVTRPAGHDGGAVAVGVSIHHAAADGQSLWQFMRAWAAASRVGSPAGPGLVPPTFDRAAIRHPKADAAARMFVRLFAPALPRVNTLPEPDWTRQSRRTYLLSAGQIRSLKQRILRSEAAAENQPSVEPPTTYVAIASLLWTSIVRAKSLHHHHAAAAAADDDDGDSEACCLRFAADCRRRLHPPLDAGFFGCCVKSCYARARAGDLLLLRCGDGVDAGLAHAASAVRRAVREQLEGDPLGDVERWAELNRGVGGGPRVQLGASHRFMAYETDFGWGAPSRVELVSVFGREIVMLLGARRGAVKVSVAPDRECMEAFEASFFSQVSACSASFHSFLHVSERSRGALHPP